MKRPTDRDPGKELQGEAQTPKQREEAARQQGGWEPGGSWGTGHQLQNYLWQGEFSLLGAGGGEGVGAGRVLGRRSNFRNWMFHLPLVLGAVPCSVVARPRSPHMSLPSCSGS